MDIKVRDLKQTETIENDDKLMVLVDDDLNLVKNITKEEFLTNIISNAENNALEQEEDGNLYVNTSEIADSVAALDEKFTNQIGNLEDLTTEDKANLVAAINEATTKGSGGSGTSQEILHIGLALDVDETKGLQRILNGSTVSISDNTQGFLTELKALRAKKPEYFTDEAGWQATAALSPEGLCDKFVIDESAGTIRLPNFPKYILAIGDTAPVVGNGTSLGFTNGADFGGLQRSSDLLVSTQAYGAPVQKTASANTYISGYLGVTTEPEKSGIIADLSNSSVKLELQYYIQIATGATTEVNITNELELAIPFTLFDYEYSEFEKYNICWGKGGSLKSKAVYPSAYNALLIELNPENEVGQTYDGYTKRGLPIKNSTDSDITEYDFVVYQSTEEFKLPTKVKMLPLGGTAPVVGNGLCLGLTDGDLFGGFYERTDNAISTTKSAYGAPVGSSFSESGGYFWSNNCIGVTTDPTNSGLIADLSLAENENAKLYFFIGALAQNVPLANIGRIEEQLPDKLDKNDKQEILSWGIPDFSKEVSIYANTPDTIVNYTVPASGWFYIAFTVGSAANKIKSIAVNGHLVATGIYSAATETVTAFLLVKEGDIISTSLQGYVYLYYYPFIGDN